MNLNNKRRKTLELIFTDPIVPDLSWQDVESLFTALGATVVEGKGSRVRILLNDVAASFHRPHPQNDTAKSAVKSVREFLVKAGIEP